MCVAHRSCRTASCDRTCLCGYYDLKPLNTTSPIHQYSKTRMWRLCACCHMIIHSFVITPYDSLMHTSSWNKKYVSMELSALSNMYQLIQYCSITHFTQVECLPSKMLAHHIWHFTARSRYQWWVDEEGWDAGLIKYCQSDQTDTSRAYTTATVR